MGYLKSNFTSPCLIIHVVQYWSFIFWAEGGEKLGEKKENQIELKKLFLAREQESHMGELYIPNTRKSQ